MKILGPEIDKYLRAPEGAEYISRIRDYRQEVKDAVEMIQHGGDRLPWGDCEDIFRFRPGELTVVAGVNSHGKTGLASFIAFHLLRQGRKVLKASFEHTPGHIGYFMAKQAAGSTPSDDYIDRFLDWAEDLYVYDKTGVMDWKRMGALVEYAADEYGIHHCFIDSFMKLNIAPGDYDRQKEAMNYFTGIAKSSKVHIHLLMHKRKGDKNAVGDRYDISGGANISDLADNVMMVWRNEAKEVAPNDKNKLQADALLVIDKQRLTGKLAKIKLWHHSSGQFVRQTQKGVDGPEAKRMQPFSPTHEQSEQNSPTYEQSPENRLL